jgi:serine/threonine protein kinase
MTQSEAVCEPRGELTKFTYASGARPLDGYTIKRGVGCGGFGEVYYATSDGGKDVALKLIRRNLDVELRGVRQCLNLKHPHLVELYDVRQDAQGDTWVVMQYMAGDCLEAVLAAHPQGLPEQEALRWFTGLDDAVA